MAECGYDWERRKYCRDFHLLSRNSRRDFRRLPRNSRSQPPAGHTAGQAPHPRAVFGRWWAGQGSGHRAHATGRVGVRRWLVCRRSGPAGGAWISRVGYGECRRIAGIVRWNQAGHHRARGRGHRHRCAGRYCGRGRPGGAERRNRRDLHGPRAPARTGPRRIGLADYTVSFCRLAGRAARRSFGSRLSVRGQAGDELVWSRPVGGAFRRRHRCRLDRSAGGPSRRRWGRCVARDRWGACPAGAWADGTDCFFVRRHCDVRADRPTSGVRRLPRVLAAGYRTRWWGRAGARHRTYRRWRLGGQGSGGRRNRLGRIRRGTVRAHRRLDSVQRGLPPSARYRYGDNGLPASERVRAARPRDSRPADHPRACVAHDSGRLGGGKPCDCGGRRRWGRVHRCGRCSGRTRHGPAHFCQARSAWPPSYGRGTGRRRVRSRRPCQGRPRGRCVDDYRGV
jgi:purT: phosphoribosylglycinamide formyltransferase 2